MLQHKKCYSTPLIISTKEISLIPAYPTGYIGISLLAGETEVPAIFYIVISSSNKKEMERVENSVYMCLDTVTLHWMEVANRKKIDKVGCYKVVSRHVKRFIFFNKEGIQRRKLKASFSSLFPRHDYQVKCEVNQLFSPWSAPVWNTKVLFFSTKKASSSFLTWLH